MCKQYHGSKFVGKLSFLYSCSFWSPFISKFYSNHGSKFVGHDYSFNAWKVEEVRGIPNCGGSSKNSALWILD